jgi:CheY-like chemotaxis protein
MKDAVQGIVLAARRGAAVSRKLLTFSRREAIRPEVVDIVAAWEEAAPMLRQLFVDTHVVSFDQGLPRPAHVLMDRAQFELSLLNIAANARDAMPGGGRFEATLRPWQDGGVDGVAVELRDTGSGMSEAVRQRIFEPYFTTKPIGAGTGLGLAVVRDAFMASGGWVQVESVPGEGSCFRLWLPIVDGEDDVDVPRDGRSERAPETKPERAPRVLLVEDDEELRLLLMDAFDDAGCVAMGKATGEEATVVLENPGYTFDVVVSDCHAPGNPDGHLAWLETTRLPVVLISAHGGAEADRLKRFGVDVHCLPKPFEPKVLVDTVRRVGAALRSS